MFISTLFSIVSLSSLNIHAAGWGYSKNPHHLKPEIGKYQKIIDGTNSYYVGNDNKEIYLTFDSGYDNGVLSDILDVLKDKNVKASFFITGDFVRRFPDLTIRLAQEGHTVCNHTYTHRKITKLDYNELKADLDKLNDAYFKLTGVKLSNCVRPPEGVFDNLTPVNLK